MSKMTLTLNDTTMNTIIDNLKLILENPYIVNDKRKSLGGKVSIHHLYGKKLNDSNCMIFLHNPDSTGYYWCKGDIFVF